VGATRLQAQQAVAPLTIRAAQIASAESEPEPLLFCRLINPERGGMGNCRVSANPQREGDDADDRNKGCSDKCSNRNLEQGKDSDAIGAVSLSESGYTAGFSERLQRKDGQDS
jgi:hypothetical protein